MSESLNHFLVDLASNPDRMAAFMANPARALDHSNLTAPERAAVLTRDGARLRTALGLSPGEAAASIAKKGPQKKGGKKKGSKKTGGKKKK